MNAILRSSRRICAPIAALALSLFGGAAMSAGLNLAGANEVPPVTSPAVGTGEIMVADDGSVSGSVKTTGIDGTMAHIHVAPAGKNGPVIVPLTKAADGEWAVPPGAKLNPEQLKSYKAGELYVNVHSAANKGGEIRAQIAP